MHGLGLTDTYTSFALVSTNCLTMKSASLQTQNWYLSRQHTRMLELKSQDQHLGICLFVRRPSSRRTPCNGRYWQPPSFTGLEFTAQMSGPAKQVKEEQRLIRLASASSLPFPAGPLSAAACRLEEKVEASKAACWPATNLRDGC